MREYENMIPFADRVADRPDKTRRSMTVTPFRIKICGITRADDFVDAITAGADAVGLNFYSKSIVTSALLGRPS